MTVSFNVTGKERKALVQALSEIVFSEAVYAGAPSFDYQVGDYTIDKKRCSVLPDTLSKEAVALVVEKLSERGFAPADEDEAETPRRMPPPKPRQKCPTWQRKAAPADQPGRRRPWRPQTAQKRPTWRKHLMRLPLTPMRLLPGRI